MRHALFVVMMAAYSLAVKTLRWHVRHDCDRCHAALVKELES